MSHTEEVAMLYTRPELLGMPFPYCPGCGHGVVHRLMAEVIEQLGLVQHTVLVTSAGCSVRMWQHFRYDVVQALHGRGAAVATGLRRVVASERIIIAYQGDGDLAAIGTGETVHAAARGENITVLFINNAFYGATGGQLAPTTPLGQVTASTPSGRDARLAGNPIKVSEMLAQLDGTCYVARVGIYDAASIVQAGKAIRKAIDLQMQGAGFSMVEILSPCPTHLHLSPREAARWVREEHAKCFPLGEIKPSRVSRNA